MADEYPVVDTAAAKSLGDALRSAGYSDAALDRLIGEDDSEDPVVAERRLPRTLLGTLVRALYLQQRVPTDDLVRALGREAVAALEATGLAQVDAEVSARVRILPVGNLLIASDDPPGPDGDQPADYVAAYTPTSRLVDALTPRLRAERALDVGTGSGVQALFAARHVRNVVATDVNARALAYTSLNAALSGLTNVECRQGPFFEPVAGESFDLITCNAPYVISPEMRLTYRDAGLRADAVSERIVRGAGELLRDNGFASLLVSWLADDEDEPDERVLAWAEDTGCDSWILPVWGADPLGHAATWNEPLSGDKAALAAAIDSWTEYLRELGARWVTEGAVLLHRNTASRHSVRVDELDEDQFDDASGQVERAFAARARLDEVDGAGELLDWRLAVAMPLVLEHELEPRSGRAAVVAASITLGEGTGSTVETSPRALDVVVSFDGSTTLGEAVEAAADRLSLSPAETTRLRRDVLRLARELLELGALKVM